MEKETKKCLCDDRLCGKCLGVNCEDENCLIHTKEAKARHRERINNNNK